MRVIVDNLTYTLAFIQLILTSLYVGFLIETRKEVDKKTYLVIIVIGLAILGTATVFTVEAGEVRYSAMHNLSSYPVTFKYNCFISSRDIYITLPVKINTSLVLYKANTNISLLYNITRTVNPDRRPEVFVDPGVFNTSNSNGSELVIYPKMWDYPNKFVESFRSSINSIPDVSLFTFVKSPFTRVNYVYVNVNGKSYNLGEIHTTLIPLVPKDDASKLALATKLMYAGLVMDFIFWLFATLFGLAEDKYFSIYLIIFAIWLLNLMSITLLFRAPVTLKKYNEDYYYLPCSKNTNSIHLYHPLANKYHLLGKSFPVAGLRDYALGHPDTIIIANLPNNVLYVGRAGLLSQVNYPLLYKGVVSPSVAEKYVKNVIVGEIDMDGNCMRKIVISKPIPVGELIRNINNVTINEFPLRLKLNYELYLTGTNDTLFRVHGTLSLNKPLRNITLDMIFQKGIIQEWILNGIKPVDAIKRCVPDYVIRVVPIGVSHYRWTS